MVKENSSSTLKFIEDMNKQFVNRHIQRDEKLKQEAINILGVPKEYLIGYDPYPSKKGSSKVVIIKKEKISLKNIYYYLQGNLRYKLYYSRFKFLIMKHIQQQISIRIKSMNEVCYNTGQCKECGCQTTQLQMCNKACKGKCYPKMLSKKSWRKLTNKKLLYVGGLTWEIRNSKFKKYE